MARVLHLTYALDFGGVESHLRLIAEASSKRHEHRFCAIANSGRVGDAIADAGSSVRALNINAWRQPLKCALAVHRMLGEEKPDIVHCHGGDANTFVLPIAWLRGVPVRIGEEVGLRKHSLKMRAYLKSIFATADAVIGVARAVTSELIRARLVAAEKAITILNPVAIPRGRPSPRSPSGRLRIAFVGRLNHWKNPTGCIAAVERVIRAGRDCELWMVGDGEERQRLERQITELGLHEKVRMFGFVADPIPLLSKCELFLQPSYSEGLSLALVEAMGCGLPAISTAVGGSPEVIDPGRTGWLIADSETESIAGAIIHAADLPRARLVEMGRAARLSVEKKFNVDRYLVELESLYDRLLSRRPGYAEI